VSVPFLPADGVPTLVCEHCGRHFPTSTPRTRCDCDHLVSLLHPRPHLPASALRQRFEARLGVVGGAERSGVWRYRELVFPVTDLRPLTWPEGNTPLLHHPALAVWAGVRRLRIKHEGLNPTGSFKDRGMTVGITQARRVGASAVACASTGNTAASLAAYASAAGLRSVVLLPAGRVAAGKLDQARAYGATILSVGGDFDAALALLTASAERLGLYLLNSINPFRIEGQKTIVLELLQQYRWRPPDWIVFPAGNLGNTAAFGKALREAVALGLIDRPPRLAAVQAAGAAPFAQSFRDGFAHRHRVQAETVATAIRIGNPASYERAVRSIRETDGVVIAVPDEEILEAKRAVDGAGVGCESASAASLAGLRRLVRDGTVDPDQAVAVVLTGHFLKEPSPPGHDGADGLPVVEGVEDLEAILAEGGP